jgi:hypothetical protein
MAGKAKSNTKKTQLQRAEHDHVMDIAIAEYHADRDLGHLKPPRGLHRICDNVTKGWKKETGREVKLNHNTLNNLAKGGIRISMFNTNKSWLLPVEIDTVIEYAIEIAARGFPLTHKLFKEHVDEICHVRLGDKFPSEGVGKNWTDRFVEKYSDRLKTYTARPLEEVRSRAVNPVTNKAWYDLLEEILEKGDDGKPIAQECCWGFDEAGFQPQIGAQAERAIGGRGKWVQHQQ